MRLWDAGATVRAYDPEAMPETRRIYGERADLVLLLGLGTEIEVTPKLRAFINANYIRLLETNPIKTALLTDKANKELGWDFSLGCQYRPLLTDNIIVSAGFGAFLPGRGYKDIYQTSTDPLPGYNSAAPGRVDDFLYSAIVAVTLTY